ncbi:MAG: hypothetical protein PHU42_00620 [Patescibacteria group bacterium]|nr:hypothetical protein [Patescibacteria group bacterium]
MKIPMVVALLLLGCCFLLATKAEATEIEIKVSVKPYAHAPFVVPGEPYKSNIVLLTPSALNKKARAVNVVVFLHGFNTDVADQGFISILKAGFETAFGDSTNTVLIAPQLAYKAEKRAAGALEEKDGLQRISSSRCSRKTASEAR